MALLEITQSRQITATIRLEEKTAEQVDKYAAFIHASADDVVNHALDYVFSKDRDFQEYLKSAEAARCGAEPAGAENAAACGAAGEAAAAEEGECVEA